MPECPTFTGPSRATQIVDSGWNKWNSFATTMANQTITYLTDLEELEFQTHDEEISVELPQNNPPNYTRPDRPETEEVELDVSGLPTAPVLDNINITGFLEAPTFNESMPTLNFQGPPEKPSDSLPPAPVVANVTLPTSPDTTLPTVPTLRDITLPEVPALDVLTFDRDAPSMTGLVVPENDFEFNNQVFADQLLTDTKARITSGMTGVEGLPDEAWNRIWNLSRQKISVGVATALNEAGTSWSKRGFTMPGQQITAAQRAARREGFAALNEATTQQAIATAQAEIALLKDYTQQGITLTSFLGQMHNEFMQREFGKAQYAFEAGLRIFEARLGLYRADLDSYRIEAEVFKVRLEANLARLEAYRAQLEGQKLIGELNKIDLEIYQTQLQGVLVAVEVYKEEINAVRAQVSVDEARINAYGGQVQAFGERIRAYGHEVQASVASIQGETAKMEGYSISARAFASEMQAYAVGNQAVATQAELELRQQSLKAEEFRAQLQSWAARVDADSKRVQAVLASFDADARIYVADAEIEKAATQLTLEEYNIEIRKGLAEAELKLKQADQRIAQIGRINGLELDRGTTIATAYGQLSSAAMAAVNLTAQISDTISEAYGCKTSHNYSY